MPFTTRLSRAGILSLYCSPLPLPRSFLLPLSLFLFLSFVSSFPFLTSSYSFFQFVGSHLPLFSTFFHLPFTLKPLLFTVSQYFLSSFHSYAIIFPFCARSFFTFLVFLQWYRTSFPFLHFALSFPAIFCIHFLPFFNFSVHPLINYLLASSSLHSSYPQLLDPDSPKFLGFEVANPQQKIVDPFTLVFL